jgi:citrate lyase subunit beta/citryl-CoA lyase
VWDIRAILAASARISQAALVETALAASLDFEPDPATDPFEYARGRLAVEATAARVGAVGMAYPMSVFEPPDAVESEIQRLAAKAKNSGMKGVLCPHPRWVAPVNAAFTPAPELVAYNRRVREAFAAGIAAGTAAVPLDGRMIDVPVDEWAIVVIAMAEACAARDAQKREALERRIGK